MEYRLGLPQSRNHHHVIHCLDALRRDVICNADDIPRYTTSDPIPETGHGQLRQCRSWDKLNDWAKRYNACYRYTHEASGNYPEVQRLVWCPEGSPYRQEVDKYFVVDYDAPRGSGVIRI
jgi:Mycotoxin biosynthesis protein UstYa